MSNGYAEPMQEQWLAWTGSVLSERSVHRCAVDAAIWGMPIVAFDAMRTAFFRDGGARYGDVVHLSRDADWRWQAPAASASTLYAIACVNTKHGAMVIEVPPAVGATLYGSIHDAWQVPLVDIGVEGEDAERGARFLVLPPGHPAEHPPGYVPLRSETHNAFVLLRCIPESTAEADRAAAVELLERVRVHALDRVEAPPPTRHLDVAGRAFDAAVCWDDGFYEHLARMMTEESVQTRDLLATAQLRAIGIDRSRPFAPTAGRRALLRTAVAEAHAILMHAVTVGAPFAGSSRWTTASPIGQRSSHTFRRGGEYYVEERAAAAFLGFAPPRQPLLDGVRLHAMSDARGEPLQGYRRYVLRVPPGVPARRQWSVTAYDRATCAFLRDAPCVAIGSATAAEPNDDGSIDVHFAPTAPEANAANWITTAPGKAWFATFHVHGPDTALLEKRWVLPDIERR